MAVSLAGFKGADTTRFRRMVEGFLNSNEQVAIKVELRSNADLFKDRCVRI
jgi:hypothetical protein